MRHANTNASINNFTTRATAEASKIISALVKNNCNCDDWMAYTVTVLHTYEYHDKKLMNIYVRHYEEISRMLQILIMLYESITDCSSIWTIVRSWQKLI